MFYVFFYVKKLKRLMYNIRKGKTKGEIHSECMWLNILMLVCTYDSIAIFKILQSRFSLVESQNNNNNIFSLKIMIVKERIDLGFYTNRFIINIVLTKSIS